MDLQNLYQIIEERKKSPASESYTARLMEMGQNEILKKVGEEAVEVIIAASGQTDKRLVEEISDLAYHVLVLMSLRGIKPEDIQAELEKRHKPAK